MRTIDFTNGILRDGVLGMGSYEWKLSGLEADAYAAANRARGLDQIDSLTVLAHDRNVALRQEVAQVDQRFQVTGENAHGRNSLAHEEIEEGIALSR